MNHRERQLLHETVGDQSPRLTLRTGTRVDTGRWTGRTPLWLCVMDEELVLLSVGRRYHVERVPLADCRDSHYNAARGGLVIAPAEGLRFSFLDLPAPTALKTLDSIHSTPETTDRC